MKCCVSKLLFAAVLVITLSISFDCRASLMNASNYTSDPKILYYITNGWKSLQRSMADCKSLDDHKASTSYVLYLPIDLKIPPSVLALKKRCSLTIKRLPKKINRFGDVNGDKITPSGLLYLPYPYIVPGGMFNEMYGWDSYFIIRGLIEDKELTLAHGIAENFFFEIDNYGGILNGNRTYYLSRTQLPFLAPVIRAIYEADTLHHTASIKWLAKAYRYAVKDYNLWTRPPHLAGKTTLSRYYDFGSGPVSELAKKSYYSDVIRYFLLHPKISQPYLLHLGKDATPRPLGTFYTISICSKPVAKKSNKSAKKQFKVCKLVKNVGLSDYFYKGDRAMRESGFDVSFRFGPFSADTLDYAPVDLNSLLYKTEKDLEWMCKQLGNRASAATWASRAQIRKEKINLYLWNEKQGTYYDYNYKTRQQSKHPYATTFYPLWAGVATKAQAKRVITNNLKLFEKPGGIVTSLRHTGVQWDYPYGWAPIQLIVIESLYQYDFNKDAHRVSHKFLMMVLKNFMKDKTIREKYNVVSGSSRTNIQIGYKRNVIGFGWTNGVFLVLLHKLPIEFANKLMPASQRRSA